MDDVRFYCGNDTLSLTLLFKRRVQSSPRTLTLKYEGNKDLFTDYKMRLAVVVKDLDIDGYGAHLGLCENDEIYLVG